MHDYHRCESNRFGSSSSCNDHGQNRLRSRGGSSWGSRERWRIATFKPSDKPESNRLRSTGGVGEMCAAAFSAIGLLQRSTGQHICLIIARTKVARDQGRTGNAAAMAAGSERRKTPRHPTTCPLRRIGVVRRIGVEVTKLTSTKSASSRKLCLSPI